MPTDALFGEFYSFDTSAIINGRRDIFLPETFGFVWEGIEQMVLDGSVRAVDEVKYELNRKDDGASQWAKRCKKMFVPLDHDIQRATIGILAEYPRLLGAGGSGSRNGADPFVIALAHARSGTVVTQETPRNITKPRIPDVCNAVGVPWMTLPQFVNTQGWNVFRAL